MLKPLLVGADMKLLEKVEKLDLKAYIVEVCFFLLNAHDFFDTFPDIEHGEGLPKLG